MGLPASIEQQNVIILTEALAARERLVEDSAARLKLLTDSAPIGIFRTDAQHRFVYTNPRWTQMTGISAEKAHGRDWDGILASMSPVGSPLRDERDCPAFHERGSCFRVWIAGSAPRILLRVSERIFDTAGAVIGTVGTFADITDQVKAEKELARSERLLAAGELLSHVGSFTVDLRTDEVTWSAETYRLLGFAPGSVEANLDSLLERIHTDDRTGFGSRMERSIAAAETWEYEFRVVRDDGTVRWIQGRTDVTVENGIPISLVGMIHDVTARREMEEELRKSEHLFRGAFDAAQTGISLTLSDGITYADVNPALCAMLGYSKDELMALNWCIITHPDDLEMNVERFDEFIAGRKFVDEFTKHYVRKDGSTIKIEVNDAVVRDDDGAPMYFVTHITDVTKREEAAREHEKLEIQLFQSQKMEAIGQLAGGIAHDFNNILSVILNYAEFAAHGLEADDARLSDIHEISKAGEKAARLVHQLLAFSRKEVVAETVIDLNEIVTGVSSMLSRSLGEDIDLTFEALDGLPPVTADPGRIEQMLLNLCLNARDAMPDGGSLRISSDIRTIAEGGGDSLPAGGYVLLTVADSGFGMDQPTLDRIFEPFFTTKPRGEGTGMGLSSAHGIIQQAGGGLFAASEVGVGTTISIYLPRSDLLPVAAPAQQMLRVDGGPETILLVEDEGAVRELTSRILRKQGYEVVPFSNGADALDYCRTTRGIDLLLTDVVMPKVSGQQLSVQATAIRPDLKTLFMSGYTDALIAQRGVLSSAQELMLKPFKPNELLARVRSALDTEVVLDAQI